MYSASLTNSNTTCQTLHNKARGARWLLRRTIVDAGLAGGCRRRCLILREQVLVELLLLPHADARSHKQAHLQLMGQRRKKEIKKIRNSS